MRSVGIVKDLLEKLVTLVPTYVGDFLRLTSGPKQFLTERVSSGEAKWADGFIFLAISFVLAFLMGIPLASGDADPVLDLASEGVFVLIYVMLFGYAVYLSWRVLGRVAPIQLFFVIHFYVAGVLKLILTATFLAAVGVLRVGDPALSAEMLRETSAGHMLWWTTNAPRLLASPAMQICVFVFLAGAAGMLAWTIAAWGAYRLLNGFSRVRSALAFLFFCAACVPVYAVTAVIATALVK
jgi:hypothetical protein